MTQVAQMPMDAARLQKVTWVIQMTWRLDDENKQQQHVMINMELHKEYKMNILQYKCII